jgi:hypothetical protein
MTEKTLFFRVGQATFFISLSTRKAAPHLEEIHKYLIYLQGQATFFNLSIYKESGTTP